MQKLLKELVIDTQEISWWFKLGYTNKYAADDVVAEADRRNCREVSRPLSYVCDRVLSHAGDHIEFLHTSANTVYYRWPR